MVFRTIFDATKTNNYTLVLKYLTEYENNPNERDENGLTCLHYCATYGFLETAKVLVSYGADLEIKDLISGWTALHRAIYFQHIKLTLFLIQVGAKLDLQSYAGTELIYPRKLEPGQMVNERNDVATRDNEGLTPLDLMSIQLKKELRSDEGHSLQGVIMSFGKADFTLGVPLPKASEISRPKRIDSLIMENIASISASKYHALAVTSEGQVYSWGNGKSGKLGHGDENSQPEPLFICNLGKIRVLKVSAADSHSLIATNEGVVYSWGSDRFGQLGHGGQQDVNRWIALPKRVDNLKKEHVLDIAAGDHHSLCFTNDGKVFAWGSNKNGQLGMNSFELSTGPAGVICSHVPKRVPVVTQSSRRKYSTSVACEIKQIAAAYQSSLLLCTASSNCNETERWRSDYTSEVYQWGDGVSQIRRVYFNPRGSAKRSKSNEFAADQAFLSFAYEFDEARAANIIQIAAGKHHFVGLSSLGTVYTWGFGSDQLGHAIECNADPKYISSPQVVEGLLPENGGGKVVNISASGNRTCAITNLGDLFTWGATHDKGVLSSAVGISYQPVPKKVYGIKRASKVSAGEDYTLVLLSVSVPSIQQILAENLKEINPKPAVDEYNYGDDLYFAKTSSQPKPLFSKEIPSLQTLCIKVVSRSVTLKNALSGLVFADKFDFAPLSDYCSEYVRRNLDALILQTKPTDLERILDELIDFQSILKKRKESFSEGSDHLNGKLKDANDLNAKPSCSVEKDVQRKSSISERNVSAPIPSNTKFVEKKDFMGIDNSQDMNKAIRSIKKKLQSIEEIEDRIRKEGYTASKEQLDKLSKKSELQIELAKMEQYLLRLMNREKIFRVENGEGTSPEKIPIPSGDDSKKEDLQKRSIKPEENTQQIEEKKGESAASSVQKKSKKTKYTPSQLNLSTSVPVALQTGNFPSPHQAEGSSAPMSYSQWLSICGDPTPPSSIPSVIAPVSENNSSPMSKKISISSAFMNGRTVLSPPQVLINAVHQSDQAKNTASVTPIVEKGSTPSALKQAVGGFSLADFITPSKKQGQRSSTKEVTPTRNTPEIQLSIKEEPIVKPVAWGKKNIVAILSTPSPSQPPPSPPQTSAWGNKNPAVTAPSTATSTISSTPKKSLLQIQQEEEFLRQNSDLPTLKGNQVPWKIDRQLRAEPLQQLIEKEKIAKQENEEILREVKAFEEKEKAQKRSNHKSSKSKSNKSRNGPSTPPTSSSTPSKQPRTNRASTKA